MVGNEHNIGINDSPVELTQFDWSASISPGNKLHGHHPVVVHTLQLFFFVVIETLSLGEPTGFGLHILHQSSRCTYVKCSQLQQTKSYGTSHVTNMNKS